VAFLVTSIHSELFSPAVIHSMHCSCRSLCVLTPHSRSLSRGDVTGIAIGSAAALIAIGVVALYFIIRKKTASQSVQYSSVNPIVSYATPSMTEADQRSYPGQVGNIRESVYIG